MLAIIISGFYMMATAWGNVAWITVTLGALVLVIMLSLVFTRPRMAAIGHDLASEKGQSSQTIHNLANHSLLWISIQTRVAIALDIVFLKTVKPDLSGSLLIIGIAIVLGLASDLLMRRRVLVHAELAS